MPRLLSPDDACVQVDIPTVGGNRRYTGKTIDVSDARHVNVLRQVGYTVADVAQAPVRSGGFTCTQCGFKAFFARCGRCGGDCKR